MINLSTAPLRRPLAFIILFLAMAILGIRSFTQLKVANMPVVEEPDIAIIVSWPGATPSQIEASAVTKLENALASLDSIQHIYSNIRPGTAYLNARFSLSRQTRDALADVRDAVGRVRSALPPGVAEPVVRVENQGRLLLTYVIEPATSLDVIDATSVTDDTVIKALSGVPGVERVTRQGGYVREVHIELDPVRLAALRLPADDVAAQLRAAFPRSSGGALKVAGHMESLDMQAPASDVTELGRLGIVAASGSVPLSDIATIGVAASPDSQPAYFNSKAVIGVNVYAASDVDETALAGKLAAIVERLNQARHDIHIREINNHVDSVAATYRHSMEALYTGCLLAIVVVWHFLRDARATVICAVSLPLSILPAFLVMRWCGYSLNTVTLLALTLVIGVLIDDAIVEVENIVRHISAGTDKRHAISVAVNEIALAVLATSLALVAIFLPTAFLDGVTGRYFWQFGWTASIAVLFSLAVARFLIPVLALGLLNAPKGTHRTSPVPRRYLRLVGWCLTHGKVVFAASLALLALTMWLFTSLPRSFLPPEEAARVIVAVEVSPGSPPDATARVILKAIAAVSGIKEVAASFASVGSASAPGGVITFYLKPMEARKRTQAQVASLIRVRLAAVNGARFLVDRDTAGETYTLVLSGDDTERLHLTAEKIVAEAALAGLRGIVSSEALRVPEWVAQPDPQACAVLGVEADSIARTLQIATGQADVTQLPYLQLATHELPVRTGIALPPDDGFDALQRLPVAAKGGSVPLGTVASLSRRSEPANISRYDRRRNLTLSIPLESRTLGEVADTLESLPIMQTLPVGVTPEPSGDAAFLKQLFGSFFGAMVLGVLCIYVLLAVLFNDAWQPLTILVALPLSVGGALAGLALAGFSLSLPAVIGLLTLIGLVAKNSILLVEFGIATSRRRGISQTRAILLACRYRARPVVMTSCAMLGGMLPLALNLDGDNIRAQMAVTVICGLITSTALSLLLVPLAFLFVGKLTHGIRSRFRPG